MWLEMVSRWQVGCGGDGAQSFPRSEWKSWEAKEAPPGPEEVVVFGGSLKGGRGVQRGLETGYMQGY